MLDGVSLSWARTVHYVGKVCTTLCGSKVCCSTSQAAPAKLIPHLLCCSTWFVTHPQAVQV